jgi:plastocyanin
MKTTLPILLALGLCALNAWADEYGEQAATAISSPNEFYVVTAHIDGNASTLGGEGHPPEPIPSATLPVGGGLSIKASEEGKWRMRAFKFIPSQIVTTVGTELVIHFVGVQGPSHRIKVDGIAEEVQLKRGEVKTVTLRPAEAGAINFRSLDHQPSMSGQIIVLAK